MAGALIESRLKWSWLAMGAVACLGIGCSGDSGGADTEEGIVGIGDGDGDGDGTGDGDGDGDTTKLDVSESDGGGGGNPCGEGGGGGEEGEAFSFIWIANSLEGTVSKINTKTAIEEARYVAGPGVPDPSRTSVNLIGDVVVVDRNGGIAKIAVKEERCVDFNGTPGIQTSTGPGDVLAWGQDECVLWQTPLPGQAEHGARPVAWEGVGDDDCALENPRVWVGSYDGINGLIKRLDGASGQIQDEVSVPWAGGTWGPYGGATNREGEFWVIGWSTGPLVRVRDDMSYESIPVPVPPDNNQWAYGMALDKDGQPWIANGGTLSHYNPDTGTWSHVTGTAFSLRGLMIDKEGRAWAATNSPAGVMAVDTETETLLAPSITLAGATTPVGISIDVDGYVWVVDQTSNAAYKMDPDTYVVEATVGGLNGPYTYSDMTGAGLDLVTHPPQL
jgi:hypothetical protein